MEITYDPLKNKVNQLKHGIALSRAVDFEWDDAVFWRDERLEYGEVRYSGLGMIANRLYFIVFVERNNALRIISLRKANKREVRRYAGQT